MKQYHKNPRQITGKQYGDLERWLRELGDLSGIVHDLNSDEIIGGNQRSRVFDVNKCQVELSGEPHEPDEQGTVAHGFIVWEGKRYAYRQVRWDARQCEQANIVANKAGGGWDFDTLANNFELDDLLDWGFEPKELDLDLWAKDEPPEDPGAQIDKAEELREKWGVESGQLWQLGAHRLICGDCTDRAVVERVMGGERADCMWTDPPYGVDYVGKTKDALTIENDGADSLPGLLFAAFSTASGVIDDGAPFYIAAPPGRQSHDFSTAILSIPEWRWHETLVWVKDSMVLGHSDYHYRHEIVYYGWKGQNRNWYAGRDQTTVFEIPRPKRSAEHPTMKPPELVEAHLKNSTLKGDNVYEPFAGSGTTLIACERLGRKCRAVEISAGYCAVAIERWVTMTGGGIPELLE